MSTTYTSPFYYNTRIYSQQACFNCLVHGSLEENFNFILSSHILGEHHFTCQNNYSFYKKNKNYYTIARHDQLINQLLKQVHTDVPLFGISPMLASSPFHYTPLDYSDTGLLVKMASNQKLLCLTLPLLSLAASCPLKNVKNIKYHFTSKQQLLSLITY